ncbi:MAG TPA: preprotein translocase subunit SecG [Flavisolibacter sp.]
MTVLFVILVIIAAVVLSLFVLVQNPKGGGLAGNIAGFSTQFMGVKQTTDVLEKGTWIFAGVIAALCLFSTFFISGGSQVRRNIDNIGSGTIPTQQQQRQPAQPSNNTAPFQQGQQPANNP